MTARRFQLHPSAPEFEPAIDAPERNFATARRWYPPAPPRPCCEPDCPRPATLYLYGPGPSDWLLRWFCLPCGKAAIASGVYLASIPRAVKPHPST